MAVTLAGSVTSARRLQRKKVCAPMAVTPSGMTAEVSSAQ